MGLWIGSNRNTIRRMNRPLAILCLAVVACALLPGCDPVPDQSAAPPTAAPVTVTTPDYVVIRPVRSDKFPGAREAFIDGRAFYFTETDVLLNLLDFQLQDIETSAGSSGAYALFVSLNAAGEKKLTSWTSSNVGKTIGVFLDGRLISAPTIQSPLSDTIALDGEFSKEQAEAIAARLRRGGAA